MFDWFLIFILLGILWVSWICTLVSVLILQNSWPPEENSNISSASFSLFSNWNSNYPYARPFDMKGSWGFFKIVLILKCLYCLSENTVIIDLTQNFLSWNLEFLLSKNLSSGVHTNFYAIRVIKGIYYICRFPGQEFWLNRVRPGRVCPLQAPWMRLRWVTWGLHSKKYQLNKSITFFYLYSYKLSLSLHFLSFILNLSYFSPWMNCSYNSTRMAKIKSTDNTRCWQGCGEIELSWTAGQSVNENNHLWKL